MSGRCLIQKETDKRILRRPTPPGSLHGLGIIVGSHRGVRSCFLLFLKFSCKHANALKYHCKDESYIDISYPQYEILPRSSSHL